MVTTGERACAGTHVRARGSGPAQTRWNDPTRLPLYAVAAAVLFGLVVLWPEQRDVWYLNDASVHRSMVTWATDRIRDGHLPFDGWYPYLSLGASRFHHYQSLPHILTGTVSLLTGAATFRWSLYLLLAFWPVSVYAGARLFGLGRLPAAAAALLSPLLSSTPGLGYEWGSYVWRGSGAWAQLWGMWALPFAWGLAWQAVSKGRRVWLAALVLGLTICMHLLTGYLALCCIPVFVLIAPKDWRRRLVRSAGVLVGAALASAWMLVPLVTDAGWTVNDEFSRGTIYYDSFGAKRVMTWFATGGLFDNGRLPVITVLVLVGLVVAAAQARGSEPPRAVIGVGLVSLLLFFGRPTLGPLIDLMPGGGDLFLRRFISGVHLASLYLAGIGLVFLGHLLVRLVRRWLSSPVPAIAVTAALALLVLVPTARERIRFEGQGGRWIAQQQTAEATDGLGFSALVRRAQSLGSGRIFAGLRGPAVADYRIGQVPAYAALLNLQADAVGFTRPTWSLMSPAEYRYDPGSAAHRDHFGVRYVIAPADHPLPSMRRVAQVGRHVLWETPENGYLKVIDTIAPLTADRRNLGVQSASILSSGLYARGYLPTVAFGGRPAAEPTLGKHDLPAMPPGKLTSSEYQPAEGRLIGGVDMGRNGVVLFKVSFDPRWVATVDGEEVPTQMIAPAMVGVPVAAGKHEVTLLYSPFPLHLPLFLLGALGIVGLRYLEGRRRRLRTSSRPT